MDHPVAPLLLVSKLRNNRMIKMREGLGMTAPQVAETIGVAYSAWILLESMKESPLRRNGQWRTVALKIADWFKVMPEDLWPAEALAVERSTIEKEITVEEAHLLMSGDTQQAALPDYQSELDVSRLEEALKTLPPRQEKILRMRFGLDGGREHTYDELTTLFDVTRERVRQIEIRALRTLRHPSRTKIITGYVPRDEGDQSIVRCRYCETPLARRASHEMFRCGCGKTTSE